MQALIEQFKSKLELIPTKFLREHHNQINWDCRIIGILGQKGVGKSTLILQHIKLQDNISEVLYVQADDIYFGAHTILELAKKFYSHGGRILYVDEIHKYNNWSHEIKLIYDQVPLLKVVYSGSSILDLEQGGADLSRRVVQYHLPVWSLREFLNLRNGWSLRVSTLQEVLSGKVDFPYGDERPLKYFDEYLHKGCYPFFIELEFEARLRQVINTTVSVDIPKYAKMTVAATQKLQKLMYYLSQSVPVKINFSDMERDLNLNRNELPKYLEYLEKAELISILRMKATGNAILRKMDKLYLHNPNIANVLAENTANTCSIRESIFLCWARAAKYDVYESPVSDFEINNMTFEVGGRNKGKKQIESVTNGYIVKDGIEYAYENQIPLWMFGFLY